MTPYEIHETLNHGNMVRSSPNGVDIIEECDHVYDDGSICGQRWIHNPSIGYPVTLCTIDELNRRRNTIARTIINV